MESSLQPPRRRPRWLQFGMSHLLLVTLVAAVLVAWQRERISRWVESLWIISAETVTEGESRMVAIQVTIAEVDGTRASGGVNGFKALGGAEQDLRSASFDVSSASGEAIVAELRKRHRVSMLSRPQIMTLSGQPACVQVGQRIQLVQVAEGAPSEGTVATPSKLRARWATEDPESSRAQPPPIQQVGFIFEVTPRVSQQSMALEIDMEYSEAAPQGPGVPFSTDANGKVLWAPRINTSTLQTTVSVQSGQTTILGGIFTGDGKEVVIILTPRVIGNEDDTGQTP
jgi:type II secretory pathway component GspD/PulD (secretin)